MVLLRNSIGVYQSDERLKTCYGGDVRPVDFVWRSCLLIVWSVTEQTTQGYKTTAYVQLNRSKENYVGGLLTISTLLSICSDCPMYRENLLDQSWSSCIL